MTFNICLTIFSLSCIILILLYERKMLYKRIKFLKDEYTFFANETLKLSFILLTDKEFNEEEFKKFLINKDKQ